MKIPKIAIIGYGNIGKAAAEAVKRADDLELFGIVRRGGSGSIDGVPVVSDIGALSTMDVAIICHPSTLVPELAAKLARVGINTVDSFDIHASVWDYVSAQDEINKKTGTVSIASAGWDPGTDSVIRTLLEAMAPEGVTHTNFGPGLSMGHSVAARAVAGVKDALSITIPKGGGVHGRKVYIELEDGFDFDKVAEAVKNDAYFVHDATDVELVDALEPLKNTSHGVLLERNGTSGVVDGQKFSFDMHIDNPALTGQILVSCARATKKLAPGCYTVPEIPPFAMLCGNREALIKKLV